MAMRQEKQPSDPAPPRGLRLRRRAKPRCQRWSVAHIRQAAGGLRAPRPVVAGEVEGRREIAVNPNPVPSVMSVVSVVFLSPHSYPPLPQQRNSNKGARGGREIRPGGKPLTPLTPLTQRRLLPNRRLKHGRFAPRRPLRGCPFGSPARYRARSLPGKNHRGATPPKFYYPIFDPLADFRALARYSCFD